MLYLGIIGSFLSIVGSSSGCPHFLQIEIEVWFAFLQFGQNLTKVCPQFLQLTEPRRAGVWHFGHSKISRKLQLGQWVSSFDTLVLHFGQIKTIILTRLSLFKNIIIQIIKIAQLKCKIS